MKDFIQELNQKGNEAFQELLKKFPGTLNKEQQTFLTGYFAGAAETNRQLAITFAKLAGVEISASTSQTQTKSTVVKEITILYGSHTGNGKGFSKRVKDEVEKIGYKVNVCDMAQYKTRDLKNEKNLIVLVSTHGEGDAPAAAEELHEFIHSTRAPKLDHLNYAVLALGDKTYIHFCKTGIEFDTQLEKLGAKRILNRVDCDADFLDTANEWLKTVVEALKACGGTEQIEVKATEIEQQPKVVYSQKNPYLASILSKVNLNGRGSEKETWHVELAIDGQEITYKPGDACGILPQNSEKLVGELVSKLNLAGSELVDTSFGRVSLTDALKRYELTVLTPDTLRKHNEYAASRELSEIIFDNKKLKDYIYGRDIIDLFHQFPVRYSPVDLLKVLRPVPPRLYSIASSQLQYPDEIHLLVGALRYNAFGREKEGVASSFWADRLNINDKVPIYIKQNEGFRLPDDGTTPIIMIGPGTGVAPFRSFVDERLARGDAGKNWLFFGNQHLVTDFMYQSEWLEHLKKGSLARLDVAFSRDQDEKVYVQHKILKKSKEIFRWLEENAKIYVCGDIQRMAPDVHKAFVEIVQKEGGMSAEKATEFIKSLKREGRYLEDVY